MGEQVALDLSVSHHILRVTGIAPGETFELFDPNGAVLQVRLAGVQSGRAVAEILGEAAPAEPSEAPLYLLVGLCRSALMESILRQATEQGVTAIIPVQARRSIAREPNGARWARIIQSAVGQSGRTRAPELSDPRDLLDALSRVPTDCDRRICLPGAPRRPGTASPAAVLVGPEGGWDPAECLLAHGAGFTPMGLGPWILRAETAVVAALSAIRTASS